MKNKSSQLPKKETRPLYIFQGSQPVYAETTSTSGDPTGTCTTATTTTHFNR